MLDLLTDPAAWASLATLALLEIVLELLLVHLAASRAQLKRHLLDHPSPLPAQPYVQGGQGRGGRDGPREGLECVRA